MSSQPQFDPSLVACGDTKQKVLAAVAQELADLSKQNVALQGLVGSLLKSDVLSNTNLIEVQTADMLAQHLVELSKFLASYVRLCEAGEANSVSAALNDIVLSALAERLAGACLGATASKPPASEPVEFF